MKIIRFLLLCLSMGVSFDVGAQVTPFFRWRVSVKIILDANGNRPTGGGSPLSTDAQIQTQIAYANRVFDLLGLNAGLDLTEIAQIGGPSAMDITSKWQMVAARDSDNRSALENDAYDDPRYLFRRNAINVYINGSTGSGVCAIPGTFGFLDLDDDNDDIMLLGQGGARDMMIHEAGHFLGLYHTQGSKCGNCGENGITNPDDCGDDEVYDTITDSACWKSQDQISLLNGWGNSYGILTPDRQRLVDLVWNNVMSYHQNDHANQTVFTPGQIERLGKFSNQQRRATATGNIWFVRGDGDDDDDGDEESESFQTVGHAVDSASDGDLLLLRAGRYNQSLRITKRVAVNALHGPVTIGKP